MAPARDVPTRAPGHQLVAHELSRLLDVEQAQRLSVDPRARLEVLLVEDRAVHLLYFLAVMSALITAVSRYALSCAK